MSSSAAFFDLDRTLIATSSAPVFQRHLSEAGLGGASIPFPITEVALKFYETFGESWVMMQPAKLGVKASDGWSIDTLAMAMKPAAAELESMLAPFAKIQFDRHRAQGDKLVLATTSPAPMVRPLAERLGFDAVLATEWSDDGTHYDGSNDGPFVWGKAKEQAAKDWADSNSIDMSTSYAYSDSYFDSPLLDAVGNPVAVNPDARLAGVALLRGWPIRHLDRSEGIIKLGPLEPQEWARPLTRPELIRFADIQISGTENIPKTGGAIIVFNHRSYFDPAVVILVGAKAGRSLRGLGKREIFDIPLIGGLLKGLGGVPVNRGSGSDQPIEAGVDAVKGGEVLLLAPQGTIPRGEAFFDPVLKGRWGAAKIAAESKAPVIPIGLWGTEKVWPRSAKFPNVMPRTKPIVTAVVGPPVELKYRSPNADTKRIMAAISELLPEESRTKQNPTEDELRLTYPSGHSPDQ